MQRERLLQRACGLLALADEMLVEELLVGVVLVELVGREHDREDGYACIELHAHQALDDGLSDELVAVDAAVDDEAEADDRVNVAALGQAARDERDLVRTGDVVAVDVVRAVKRVREAVDRSINELAVPRRRDGGDAKGSWGGVLIHGASERLLQGSGLMQSSARTAFAACVVSLSFIRTMTVGSGISPDLLTPPADGRRALAGSCDWEVTITAGGELHPALRTWTRYVASCREV